MGSIAGIIYLQLLVADVDSLESTDGRVAPFMMSTDSQLSLKSLRRGGNPKRWKDTQPLTERGGGFIARSEI